MKSLETWINTLELQPHTEGGYFKETSRSTETFENGRLIIQTFYFYSHQTHPHTFIDWMRMKPGITMMEHL